MNKSGRGDLTLDRLGRGGGHLRPAGGVFRNPPPGSQLLINPRVRNFQGRMPIWWILFGKIFDFIGHVIQGQARSNMRILRNFRVFLQKFLVIASLITSLNRQMRSVSIPSACMNAHMQACQHRPSQVMSGQAPNIRCLKIIYKFRRKNMIGTNILPYLKVKSISEPIKILFDLLTFKNYVSFIYSTVS